jgi:hypothetical protein
VRFRFSAATLRLCTTFVLAPFTLRPGREESVPAAGWLFHRNPLPSRSHAPSTQDIEVLTSAQALKHRLRRRLHGCASWLLAHRPRRSLHGLRQMLRDTWLRMTSVLHICWRLRRDSVPAAGLNLATVDRRVLVAGRLVRALRVAQLF